MQNTLFYYLTSDNLYAKGTKVQQPLVEIFDITHIHRISKIKCLIQATKSYHRIGGNNIGWLLPSGSETVFTTVFTTCKDC